MKCDLVIPVWNELEATRRCLDSVFRASGQTEFRLILVDNGSDVVTRTYLENRDVSNFCSQRISEKNRNVPVLLIRNEQNLGFVKAANQGIRASSAPYVCLLNNDTIVTPGWLDEMIAVAESDPRVGLVNPSSNTLGQRPPGGMTIERFADSLKAQHGQWSELGMATGFCLLIKRAVLDKVGLFDEVFGLGNFEDADLSRRAQQAGYLCVRAKAAYVWHEEKTSFKRLPNWEAEFDRNRLIFEQRWGQMKRIAWILGTVPSTADNSGGDCPQNGLVARLLTTARQGHQITLFTSQRLALDHSNVRQVVVPRPWTGVAARWRILTRRKKPFDEVIR